MDFSCNSSTPENSRNERACAKNALRNRDFWISMTSLLTSLQELNSAVKKVRDMASEVRSAHYEWSTNLRRIMERLQALKQELCTETSNGTPVREEGLSQPNNELGESASFTWLNRFIKFQETASLFRVDEQLKTNLFIRLEYYYTSCESLFRMMAKMQMSDLTLRLFNVLLKHFSLELNLTPEVYRGLSSPALLIDIFKKMESSCLFSSIKQYISASRRNLQVVVLNSSALCLAMFSCSQTENIPLCRRFLGYEIGESTAENEMSLWVKFVNISSKGTYDTSLLNAILIGIRKGGNNTLIVNYLSLLQDYLEVSLIAYQTVEEMLLVEPSYEEVILVQ